MFWQLLILLVLLIPLLAVILDSQVGKALAARLEKGGRGRREEQLMEERIRYLEGEVERLSSEVRRLDEESSFLHELLADRPPPEEGGRRTLDAGDDPD